MRKSFQGFETMIFILLFLLWIPGSIAANEQRIKCLWISGWFDPTTLRIGYFHVYELDLLWYEITKSESVGNLLLLAFHENEEKPLFEIEFSSSRSHVDNWETGPIYLKEENFSVNIPLFGANGKKRVDKLAVMHKASQKLIYQFKRSKHAPKIKILYPAPGDSLVNGMKIKWEGSDADNDSLEYWLSYSWDNGKSYTSWKISETDEESYTLDSSTLPGSNPGAAILRLKASDGFNAAYYQVGNLTANFKKPPRVTLPDELVESPFIEALNDKESTVRCAAVRALGKFGNDKAVEALNRALLDKDSMVRENAAKILEKIARRKAKK